MTENMFFGYYLFSYHYSIFIEWRRRCRVHSCLFLRYYTTIVSSVYKFSYFSVQGNCLIHYYIFLKLKFNIFQYHFELLITVKITNLFTVLNLIYVVM